MAWLVASGSLTAGLYAGRAATLPLPRAAFLLAQTQPATQAGKHKKPSAYSQGFLLRGTVFTEQGFALPGAELHIRRAEEKKARWTTHTDGRGEFAIRVPKGADYAISVSARGYQEQTHAVDAKAGDGDDGIIFHMPQIAGGKSK